MEINQNTPYRRNRISELLRNNDNLDHLSESPESPIILDEIETLTENETSFIQPEDNNLTHNINEKMFEIGCGTRESDIYFMKHVSDIDLINIIETENKQSDPKSEKAFYCGYLNKELTPCGFGTLINKNNDTITGFFENGLNYVKNAKTVINNTRYDTEILNAKPDGNGNIYYPNGNTYVGNINNGTENGSGQMIYYDKAIYNGNWKMGIREGDGEYIEGDTHYRGNWMNNKKHGYGTLNINGMILEGEWTEDKKNGLFKETNIDGETTMVQYENDNVILRGNTINDEILELRKALEKERQEIEKEKRELRIELEKEKNANKKIKEERLCKICITNEVNIALPRCGHLICQSCVEQIDSREKKCPICRQRFTNIINIFH